VLKLIFPVVTTLLEPNLKLPMLLNPMAMLTIAVTVLFIVLFSATYSAIKLSMNNPTKDLKKEIIFGRDLSMGKVLLVIQFAISFFCISATLVVSRQLDFLGTKDLGFDRTNVVALIMPDEYPMEKAGVLKNELKALTGVVEVSYSYYLVTGVPYLRDWYKIESGNAMRQIQLNEIFVDHDFFNTMNIEIVAGRGFDVGNPADQKTAFIINETAAREFG
jgi:putative ABC transport system permease protein